MIRRAAHFIFFGNYFLGLCIVALSLETLVQFGFHDLLYSYFILVFFLTIVYYTHAYTTEISFYTGANARTRWYVQNKSLIKQTQAIAIVLIIIISSYFFSRHFKYVSSLSLADWLILAIFPVLALLYYGIAVKPGLQFNLRQFGWLKPFLIGFVATGAVTAYPLILFSRTATESFYITEENGFFFAANFMFTSVIALMFDIKDYAADHNHQLKTLVVHLGLRKTIYYVFMPLIVTGLIACFLFAYVKNYSAGRQLILTIPFLLLGYIAWSLQHRKKILYYLAVIDGLLLVKAACGVAAVFFFN